MASSGTRILINPPELHAALPGGRLQVIDTRPSHQYASGRIPGAIHVDLWALSLNDTDPAPLRAFMWSLSHFLTAHGVDARRTAVIYEAEQTGYRAARLFWLLEYFGHPDVRVLDGGFQAWAAAGLPVELGAGHEPPESTWPDDNSTPRREETLAGWRDVFAGAGAPAPRTDLAILDTRSREEHLGTLVRAKRGGAIPGSIHLEWKDTVDESGRLKPIAELRQMYESRGITPDQEVIAYCQGGYRAAHGYLTLRVLGYPRVRNYVSSWGEWGNREDLPIVIPEPNP